MPGLAAGLAGAGIGAGVGATTGYGLENSAQAATNAKNSANTATQQQQSQATALQNQLLQTPKQIAPDNFLATKAAALTNMRLGLASTITGPGGMGTGVLTSPSLQPGAGKTKLGS
jgi:hypothetical protein